MADGKTDDDLSRLCPICIETFKTPRSTPCKHSFCEQCLFMYVSTLKDKGELGTSFPCPVCRQDVAAPPDGNISLSWIQAFPVNEGLVNMISEIPEGKENDAPIIMCDPCAADDEQNRAVKFCIDCQENLCKCCVDMHRKYKTLKSHTLVEGNTHGHTSQMKDLSVDVKCAKHKDRDVEVYCPYHDVFCCATCDRVEHRECSGIREIDDMEKGANRMMANLRYKYELIEKHLDKVRVGHEENISSNELSKRIDDIQVLFKQKKKEIINALDNIQRELDVKAKQMIISTEERTQSILERIGHTKLRCRQNIDTIDTLNNYCLPVHRVVLKPGIADEYVQLEREMATGEMNVNKIDVEWPELSKLGLIHGEIVGCKAESLSQAKIPTAVIKCEDVLNQIAERNVVKNEEHLVNPVTSHYPFFSGLTMMANQHLILCDSCIYVDDFGYVCLYDPNTKSTSILKLNKSFGVTVLKSNPSNIAVSVPDDKQIYIVQSKDNALSIVRRFQTERRPHSLVGLDNGQLGVTSDSPPSFDIVDVSGSEMKTINSYTQDSTGRKFKSFSYVAVDELRSHIIQPCMKEDTVYCFDFSGNPVFEYRDAELKNPNGVDIDRDGNVYICSYGTHTIHILTPSGRKVKVIKEGVLPRPRAICFDETRERFWVTNMCRGLNAKVTLFSCQD